MSKDTSETTSSNQEGMEREKGPRGWLFPNLEWVYTKLVPREQAEAEPRTAEEGAAVGTDVEFESFRSTLQPDRGENVLAGVDQDLWLDRLAEYKHRLGAMPQEEVAPIAAAPPPGPVVSGQKNWAPLGPSFVINGQAQGLPPVGGRVSGIAVAEGGQLAYAATANGGVFRSDDRGATWRTLMDAFDLDPTNFASTSLACGAIAINSVDPNRVYVGTGEGDTNAMFENRIVHAAPAYRGIGPIRSDDGGETWVRESTADGSPSLAGKAFFALAVDPANRENVVAATTEGLYQRVRTADGDPEWVQRRPGIHSNVLVTFADGASRFFAAEWGRGVFRSSDGSQWSPVGTGFPTANLGRIALGVQPDNPDLVYAFVAHSRFGTLLGVYRFDSARGAWKQISNPPDVLPVTPDNPFSQGDYDLAIAVDPTDENLIYLAGSYYADRKYWPASIWRCRVQTSGSNFRMTSDSIGVHAHADVHVLVHTPGNPNALWAGCDGGVFINRAPRELGIFDSRNDGLACLAVNFFAQHPTDPSVMFCGLQDNGTARTSGGQIWRHVNGGDGGYCLINWADPDQVLVYANGSVYRATDGGEDHDSWTRTADARRFGWPTMTQPIVGPPYSPSQPADAEFVALGAGNKVHLSQDFGETWPNSVQIPTNALIFAIAIASLSHFYVGTTAGEVFRLNRSGNAWTVTRLDDADAGPLGLRGLISDIVVDWSDASLDAMYISFGGVGERGIEDYRHVWHFDGARWEARSGPADHGGNKLLDVVHNAMAVDRAAPHNIYVGADIGVWHSRDHGQNWFPLPNGLPDAPVYDLQVHPTRRLLRAATHGRGLYEYPLDPVS
jgi:photosystem II stability/assembly factor-like uncharacterized protein